MGGVPVKHHTHGKTARRRSHMALKATNLLVCPNCKAPTVPHRVCAQCGAKPVKKAKTGKKATS